MIGVVGDVRSALKMMSFAYSGIYLPTTPEQAKRRSSCACMAIPIRRGARCWTR